MRDGCGKNTFTTAAHTDLRHTLERLAKTVFKWQKDRKYKVNVTWDIYITVCVKRKKRIERNDRRGSYWDVFT